MKTLREHAIELADAEFAEYKAGKLAYVPSGPCLTDCNDLVDRLDRRLTQADWDEFQQVWSERFKETR